MWYWAGSGTGFGDHVAPEWLTGEIGQYQKIGCAGRICLLAEEWHDSRWLPVQKSTGCGSSTAMVDYGSNMLEEP